VARVDDPPGIGAVMTLTILGGVLRLCASSPNPPPAPSVPDGRADP
jgi:hypothetical protein